MRLLKHKTSGYVRVLVRADKTHKCVMNHFVIQKQIFCLLEQLKTSSNSWTWAAHDISDEKPETDKFCAKFTSKEEFDRFETEFKKSIEINRLALEAGEKKEKPVTVEEKKEADLEKTQEKKE